MPKVTIWIRVKDEAKWTAIENKPEWLHEHLNKPNALFFNEKDLVITDMGNHDRAVGKFPDGEYGIKRTAPGYRFDNVGNVIDEPKLTPPEDIE